MVKKFPSFFARVDIGAEQTLAALAVAGIVLA